ncbi:K+-transporting ATPase ATPase C chain [Motilibacter rhizosphaerae]|uniref:Potassium-transporting ATPase KdpC subunit n=1 Tax=Motilibacter rhizosphaerae TaxID=598652 RepID=A0A4Q7NV01_9ACTN|nr:potassium-transporting ATPase subunit KdpC [Motilibacter rhizosphaerae]RZS91051.1 K+-transporting ATPase ATPase C chain [Motilibacter rhizosphaerae]
MTTLIAAPAVAPSEGTTRASWGPQLLAGLRALLVLTAVLGIAYPLAITGFAQLAFHDRADGSLVHRDGQVVGSRLLGQGFTGPQWFHPRPSAAGKDGYDGTASGASNLGPENPTLLQQVQQRRTAAAAADGVPAASVPPDALTASGSGLDPDISPAYAREQVGRVAEARGLDPAVVRRLVEQHVQGRQLGFLGEPHVNVLDLDLALAALPRQ